MFRETSIIYLKTTKYFVVWQYIASYRKMTLQRYFQRKEISTLGALQLILKKLCEIQFICKMKIKNEVFIVKQ